MWKLVIEDDEGKRTVVPLTRDQYSIGRKDGNTIRLTERNVSRTHARLYKGVQTEQRNFVLEDLTSYNGVFVNGLRVAHAHDLAHGDLVQIGDYRIVLQDEALTELQASGLNDAQQTIPNAPVARAAALLDRPNRLVMLAGPTPGAEFPLDRERLTVGRAEDATISVNHNSVSRLHCEVHALGDSRFEIVDKGSSNGVRVNGAELRRGIIEPGDLIELGDVRFKFVGAGQIFRPTESQQLAAISDRVASDAVHGRSANALPIAAFLFVVAAGALGAWVYTRPHVTRTPVSTAAAAPSPDRVLVEQAKKLCAAGDCESAHTRLATLADSSPERSSSEFHEVENRWADVILSKAEHESDAATKRAMYQRVAQAMGVEASRRKTGADRLQELDSVASASATNAAELPVAPAAHPSEDGVAAPLPAPPPPPHAEIARRPTTAYSEPTVPAAAATTRNTAAGGVDERERQLALQGTTDAKMALKQQLEQRVYSGKASDTEIRLLISTCKDLGDKPCVQQARAIQAQRTP